MWHTLVKYRNVFETIVQSAAIYSAASLTLVVTMVYSEVTAYACFSACSQLIVRELLEFLFLLPLSSYLALWSHIRASVSLSL